MENHMQRVYDMFWLSVESCMCSLAEVERIQSIGSISLLKRTLLCDEGLKRYLNPVGLTQLVGRDIAYYIQRLGFEPEHSISPQFNYVSSSHDKNK